MLTALSLKQIVAGTILFGAVAGVGVVLSEGPAEANARGPYQWCPGQHLPEGDVNWDMHSCHTWYRVDDGFQANRGQFVYEGDSPPSNLGCLTDLCLPAL